MISGGPSRLRTAASRRRLRPSGRAHANDLLPGEEGQLWNRNRASGSLINLIIVRFSELSRCFCVLISLDAEYREQESENSSCCQSGCFHLRWRLGHGINSECPG